jgi:hypothetical protein
MAEGQREPIVTIYEIVIKGYLDRRWADWFEGLTFIHKDDGTTTLCGPLADQAALHGVLNGIRDLGLPLVSVSSSGDSVQQCEGESNHADKHTKTEKSE